jgi:hypothetical protein
MRYAPLIILGIVLGYISFPLIYLLSTGDFPGSAIFYGLQEDSAIVDFLLNIR